MQLQASGCLCPRLWAALGGQGQTLLLQGRATWGGSHGRGGSTSGSTLELREGSVTLSKET